MPKYENVPGKPLELQYHVIANDEVMLQWLPPSGLIQPTYYMVDVVGHNLYYTTSTSLSLKELKSDIVYQVSISGVNANGPGVYSDTIYITSKMNAAQQLQLLLPKTPTVTKLVNGDKMATIYFDSCEDDTLNNSNTFSLLGINSPITISSQKSPIVIKNLTNKFHYTFQLVSINSYGISAPSPLIQICPDESNVIAEKEKREQMISNTLDNALSLTAIILTMIVLLMLFKWYNRSPPKMI